MTNLGGARATAVQAALILPEGIEYAGEAGAGCFNADGRSLTWAVDALAPNESRRLVAVVVARATGTFDLRADAWDRTGHAVASAKDVSVQSPLDQSTGSDDQDDLVATLDRDVLAATTPPVPSPETRHLLFAVADLDFAVPIGQVLEIARPAATTPLPHLPDWLAGVTMVRGDIVSVVDLGRFLGLPRGVAEPRARLLLVRAGDVQAGLLVDRVAGVHVLPPTTGRLTERIGNDRVRPYLRGVANHNGRPLLILDLDRLFQSPEMRPFEPA